MQSSYITELKWLNSASFPLHHNKQCCTYIKFTQFLKSINNNNRNYYPKIIPTEIPFVSPNFKNHLYMYQYHFLFLIVQAGVCLPKTTLKISVTDSYDNKYKGIPKGEYLKIKPFMKTVKFHPYFFLAVKPLLLCIAR